MTLVANINNYATRVGTEFKSIRTLVGGTGTSNVSGLTTTATNLVAAINEVKTTADAAGTSSGGGATINDSVTATNSVWSSSKINAQIDADVMTAITNLVDGAPGAMNTLYELNQAIEENDGEIAGLTSALNNRVRYDAAQVLTDAQKLQASTNIGIGSPATNFVTTFEAALT